MNIRRFRTLQLFLSGLMLCSVIVSHESRAIASGTNSVMVVRLGNVGVTNSQGELTCGDVNRCWLSAEIGTEVTLSATAEPGWAFTGWDSTLCSGSGDCTFTVPPMSFLPWDSPRITAVAQPETASSDITLSTLSLPADLQGAKIRVYDISSDARYLLYVVDATQVHWRDLLEDEDFYIGETQYEMTAMSGDGQSVVTTDNNQVFLWTASTRAQTLLTDSGSRATISTDGRFVSWFWQSTVTTLDRTTGNTSNFSSSWLPVLAPDGSTVAIPAFRGLELHDPTTGNLQKVVDYDYTFDVLRISPNAKYAFGWINNAPAGEHGFARIDLVTGETRRIPHSTDAYGCSVSRFATTALDDGSSFFTTWADSENFPTGPIDGGLWDFYGMYRADFSDGSATALSATGVVLPLPTPSNNCASVVATPDGETVIFATERLLPAISQPVSTEPASIRGIILRRTLRISSMATSETRLVRAEKSTSGSESALTIKKVGAGSVAASTVGRVCGTGCSWYPVKTSVTLTAIPATGSTFTGWSGADCSGTSTCTVTMTQARSVTANFTLNTYALDVSTNGTGSGSVSCGMSCSTSFSHGTSVTLTATASTGSTFTGWSGANCSGTSTCTVTMTQARSVSANFTLNTYALNIGKKGTGSGSVSCSVSLCSTSFSHGTSVILTATAATGSTFTGWSGANCSGTSTCTVTMTQARSVTANFTLRTFRLSIVIAGRGFGTIKSTPVGLNCRKTCASLFDYNTRVRLTATPTSKSTFVGWTGACSGKSRCVVTMTQSRGVTAKFASK